MPSTNKTTNYGLNQWAGNEYAKRQDFVDDNAEIDAALTPTADPAQTPTSNGPGKLVQWVSWFVNRIKAITGKANWYDAPPTTLTAAKSHIDAAAPHSGHETPTGAQTKANNAAAAAILVHEEAADPHDQYALDSDAAALQDDLNAHKAEYVHVTNYGAVGDGTTDDTAAIQAAVDYLTTKGGGVCFFPKTDAFYLVTDEITVPVGRIKFLGSGFTEIRTSSETANVFNVTNNVERLRYVTFEDLYITTSVTKSTGAGIRLDNIFEGVIKHCRIEGLFNQVVLDRASHVKILDNQIMSGVNDNILLSNLTGIYIDNNLVDRCGGVGLHIAGNTGGLYIKVNDIIHNNVNVKIDKSLSPEDNRETFFFGTIIDSAVTDGLYVDDASSILCDGAWMCSSDENGIVLKNVKSFRYNGGTIFNNKYNGMHILGTGIIGDVITTGTKIWNNSRDNIGVYNNIKVDDSADQIILAISDCLFLGENVDNDILLGDRKYIFHLVNNYISNRLDDTAAVYSFKSIYGNIPALNQNLITNNLARDLTIKATASSAKLNFEAISGNPNWRQDISGTVFRLGVADLTTMLELAQGGDIKWSTTALAGKGIIFRTPDGAHTYRMSVDNSGGVVSTMIS